jgi:ubiquinone/menaquinone biosynthesis C-methylase UbiE
MKFDTTRLDKTMHVLDVPNGGIAILDFEGYMLAYKKEHTGNKLPKEFDWVHVSFKKS